MNTYDKRAYAKQKAIEKGRAAERAVKHYVQGWLATDMTNQNMDIDVIGRRFNKDKKEWVDVTYSVKDCKSTCKKVGAEKASLPIENKLINSRNREDWIKGNFLTCRADYNVYRVWIEDREKGDQDQLLFVKHDFLSQWLRANVKDCRRVNLLQHQIEGNRAQGRKYDDSEVILVPLKIVLAEWREGIDYQLRPYVQIKD